MKERNQRLAHVAKEYGKIFREQEDWKTSLAKYQEAKELMEKAGMNTLEIYQLLLEDIKLVEDKVTG